MKKSLELTDVIAWITIYRAKSKKSREALQAQIDRDDITDGDRAQAEDFRLLYEGMEVLSEQMLEDIMDLKHGHHLHEQAAERGFLCELKEYSLKDES